MNTGFIKNPLLYLSVTLAVIVGFQAWGVVGAQGAFQEPTNPFPTSDVSAPLETGDIEQTKGAAIQFGVVGAANVKISPLSGLCLRNSSNVMECKRYWSGTNVPGGFSTVRVANGNDWISLNTVNASNYSEIRWGDDTNDRLRFFFDYHNGTAQDKEVVTILSGGNVGIGVVNPVYKLEVDGSINFTGDLFQRGILFESGDGGGGGVWSGPDAGVISYTGGILVQRDVTVVITPARNSYCDGTPREITCSNYYYDEDYCLGLDDDGTVDNVERYFYCDWNDTDDTCEESITSCSNTTAVDEWSKGDACVERGCTWHPYQPEVTGTETVPSMEVDNDGNVEITGDLTVGYEIKTRSGSDNGWGATVSATANCSSGKKVIGGGCNGGSGDVIQDSYPPNSTSWYCKMQTPSGDVSVTTYAICANIK